jgi:hypothetical protein
MAYRRKRGLSVSDYYQHLQAKRFRKWGMDASIASMRQSIDNYYQGLFEVHHGGPKSGGGRTRGGEVIGPRYATGKPQGEAASAPEEGSPQGPPP